MVESGHANSYDQRMSVSRKPPKDDPVVTRLLRYPSGLRNGGESDHQDILATYHLNDGMQPFAFCRTGLLMNTEGSSRFIPFADIEDTSYYDGKMLRNAKTGSRSGEPLTENLPVKLVSGEVIVLPLLTRSDGMSERLIIARLLEQFVRIHRAEGCKGR